MIQWVFILIQITLLCLFYNSCESIEKKADTPTRLLNKAKQELKNGYYTESLSTALALQTKFPYSTSIADVYLLKADIYFARELFEEANGEYLKFINLYPNHKSIEYASYKRVKTWTQRIPKIFAQDLTLSKRVIDIIDEFLAQFPKSVHKKEIQETKIRILNQLEEKEFYIALFYFKRGQNKSALMRLKYLLKNFKRGYKRKEALSLILEIADRTNDKRLRSKYEKQLKRWSKRISNNS